jgi:hypothetical protein
VAVDVPVEQLDAGEVLRADDAVVQSTFPIVSVASMSITVVPTGESQIALVAMKDSHNTYLALLRRDNNQQ